MGKRKILQRVCSSGAAYTPANTFQRGNFQQVAAGTTYSRNSTWKGFSSIGVGVCNYNSVVLGPANNTFVQGRGDGGLVPNRFAVEANFDISTRIVGIHTKNRSSKTFEHYFSLTVADTLASPSVTFGVSFFAVFLGHSLCTKEKGFYCLQGRSEGLFRKMTLVFPCFVVYATYEQVSLSHAYMGRFPGNSLVLAKYPNKK